MEFVKTADGSRTIFNSEIGEHYHSTNGAYQESIHVFLEMGLQHFLSISGHNEAKVLEVGFGTGLNFLLAADYCVRNNIKLNYNGIEAFPLSVELIQQSGYDVFVENELWNAFIENYSKSMSVGQILNRSLSLQIFHQKLMDFDCKEMFDVVFFDAFAQVHQPEMWTEDAIGHVCKFLGPGGVFVTYAITGNLKRTMKSLGFKIEKVPGAVGKREMLRAIKL